MINLEYNYRITDIQCALGISQLEKLPSFLKRRREIAALYDEALAGIPGIKPLGLCIGCPRINKTVFSPMQNISRIQV